MNVYLSLETNFLALYLIYTHFAAFYVVKHKNNTQNTTKKEIDFFFCNFSHGSFYSYLVQKKIYCKYIL